MTDLLHRPKRSRLAAVVAGAAAMMLLLAGCSGGGGEDPSASAPVSEASSSSSSAASNGSPEDTTAPSPTESGPYEPATSEGPAKNVPVPEMPDAVKEPTEEGLEAAVEYWWDGASLLILTGDATSVELVSSAECVTCKSQMDNWASVYSDGGWGVGYEPTLNKIVVDASDPENGTFTYELTEGPGQTYLEAGEPVPDEWAEDRVRSVWSGFAVYDTTDGVWKIEEQEVQGEPAPVD